MTGKSFGAAVTVAAGVGLFGAFFAFRPAAKEAPPCQPWPSCYAVSTPAPTLAPIPTATPRVSPTPEPTTSVPTPPPVSTPVSGGAGCVASVVGTLSIPGGKFAGSVLDSVAIGGGNVFLRLNYGVAVYRLGALDPFMIWDLEARPGYRKVGDGFSTVSAVGISEDGAWIAAASKIDTHGTMVLDAAGRNISEFPPPRALGGVGVVTVGARYVGLALAGTALYAAPLVGTGRLTRTAIGPPGVERSLVTSGRLAAYVGLRGEVTLVIDGETTKTSLMNASAVAIEGDRVLIGVRDGYRLIGGDVMRLPQTPQVIALAAGHAWAALSEGLFCDGVRTLEWNASPKVIRGGGAFVYVGDGTSVRVIRVGS